MKVKMILPSLTEAKSPYWRPIKYSLFPPLGLATLAAYLSPDDEIDLRDEHVEPVNLKDSPDLVVIESYITSAYRAYELATQYRARGAHVCIGGLHATSIPDEAARFADTVFVGPGEDTWPQFLADFKQGKAKRLYRSTRRTLHGAPPMRRDLIKREKYLVPNSIIVSRGCPHACDFCYKEPFFKGGRSFYTQPVEDALAEIERLPGKHLYFLDDNLFADSKFASELFSGMRGMGRLFQGAGTVEAVLNSPALDKAVDAGLRSLFVGFESLSGSGLADQNKKHNLGRDYERAVRRLRDRGVMINASFVFGLGDDRADVFDRTVDWAVRMGIETSTFHILTPYPGTRLHEKMQRKGRIVTNNWNLYDTRHAVYLPRHMSRMELEQGYWKAYRKFYNWPNIIRAASKKTDPIAALRHLAYSGGWKKFEWLWKPVIQIGLLRFARPALESVLAARKSQRALIGDCSSELVP